MTPQAASPLPRHSPRFTALFGLYTRWYLARHFHAIRLANAARMAMDAHPLVVYMNHASWWDPLTGLLLRETLLPGRELYAPMEASALAHYGIFRRLGVFPVEKGTPRGAVQLLRAAKQVFARPNSVLWITPESEFRDVRRRPVAFRNGLGAVVARNPGICCVPIAVEYVFWDERLPEVLIDIGHPVRLSQGCERSAAACAEFLAAAMTETLDELATLSLARDPAAFTTLLAGGAGAGGIYELWLRLKAALSGRVYQHEHGNIRPQSSGSHAAVQPIGGATEL